MEISEERLTEEVLYYDHLCVCLQVDGKLTGFLVHVGEFQGVDASLHLLYQCQLDSNLLPKAEFVHSSLTV